MSTPDLRIEVHQQDWIPGFAAFLDDGEAADTGKAHVVLNLGSILAMVQTGDMDPKEVPYFVAESIMHEVMHALEAWAGVEFSEERIETLLEQYAAKYGPEAQEE